MPKTGKNYSKFSSDNKHVEHTQHTPQTEKRQHEETISFFGMMNGKHVEMKLTTGETFTGIRESNKFNPYDVMLRNDEAVFVVRKDVVEYVKLYLNREEGEKKKRVLIR